MADQDFTLTQEYLQSIFEYKDGELYWKKNNRKDLIGKKAGCIDIAGYRIVRIKKKNYKAHRLIFLFHYGHLPKILDHINCIKTDNRIENLRVANLFQNCHNIKNKNPVSKHKHIYWHERWGKWQVCITANKKAMYFGAYKDIDYAIFVAEAMRHKYHGKFANSGVK